MMSLSRRWYYLFFGGLFFLFWGLFKLGGMMNLTRTFFSTSVDVLVTMMVLVIATEGLLPRLLYPKKTGWFFGSFLATVFFAGTLIILFQLKLAGSSLSQYQENIIRYPRHYYYWFWSDLVFGSYFLVFFIPATGVAVRLAFDRMQASNQAEKLQKDKALSELELLRHQINPHFLFNALNMIYYKIDRSNAQARETLQRFSHLLRYQLYECDKPFVGIGKELGFIRSYIELQQERLNDNYTVSCKGLEDLDDFLIAPFLLMPLIENCFKHVSDYPDKPNLISIDCCYTADGVFHFHTDNTIVEGRGTPGINPVIPPGGIGIGNPSKGIGLDNLPKGIGLNNLQKRLELVYPGRYELITQAGPHRYEVLLKLFC
jgi:two-component system LytT family sensor kinase